MGESLLSILNNFSHYFQDMPKWIKHNATGMCFKVSKLTWHSETDITLTVESVISKLVPVITPVTGGIVINRQTQEAFSLKDSPNTTPASGLYSYTGKGSNYVLRKDTALFHTASNSDYAYDYLSGKLYTVLVTKLAILTGTGFIQPVEAVLLTDTHTGGVVELPSYIRGGCNEGFVNSASMLRFMTEDAIKAVPAEHDGLKHCSQEMTDCGLYYLYRNKDGNGKRLHCSVRF